MGSQSGFPCLGDFHSEDVTIYIKPLKKLGKVNSVLIIIRKMLTFTKRGETSPSELSGLLKQPRGRGSGKGTAISGKMLPNCLSVSIKVMLQYIS